MELVDQSADDGDVGLRIVRHSSGQTFCKQVFTNLICSPVLPFCMAEVPCD